ncbi:MAG: C40 family peptidase [Tenacibaculum sp.]|nr:C40 family peptidase [Tenacibaculum sp.]
MNKKVLFILIVTLFCIYRCFNRDERAETNHKIEKVIDLAKSFKGVCYRAGGTSRLGMDCSGLVITCFNIVDIGLPRSSSSMSEHGEKIPLEEISKGDLLFFNIDRLKGKVNHVGLVTSIKEEEIEFIHSTTSKGVIYSSLTENYWKNSFVVAKRIITH